MNQAYATRCSQTTLLPNSPFYLRSRVDRDYVLKLQERYLLQNHYAEAGMLGDEFTDMPYMHGMWTDRDYHKGWEDPTCQLRGHFLGHWMSAACYLYQITGDARLKGKVDFVVSELARCQARNGNGWVASIPEKYLDWVARGEVIWAPHYTIHKLFMGLIDAVRLLGNQQALNVAEQFAGWFTRWTAQFDEEKMQDILDVETGGMMEAFADLYALTGNPEHLTLMKKYEHRRLFDRLLKGEDILTNRHANTTIPEVHGICRAYELTGDARYLSIMKAYWKTAVRDRGAYLTGGQSLGEIWTPCDSMDARIGHKTQEHCTVYNMIRLADYLYRAEGGSEYQDYIEENLYNGVLAQCFYKGYADDYGHHSSFSNGFRSTVVTYFLPTAPGSQKIWSSETEHFFCCHGSAVQACATFQNYVYYKTEKGYIVNQYINALLEDGDIRIELWRDPLTESIHRPDFWRFHIQPSGGNFPISLRVPAWSRRTKISIGGVPVTPEIHDGYLTLTENWNGQEIVIDFSISLSAVPLCGGNRYAFREGPVALVGIIDHEISLHGPIDNLSSWILPQEERQWDTWNNIFGVFGQEESFTMKYLYEIYNETYTAYFPVLG